MEKSNAKKIVYPTMNFRVGIQRNQTELVAKPVRNKPRAKRKRTEKIERTRKIKITERDKKDGKIRKGVENAKGKIKVRTRLLTINIACNHI